MKEFFIHTILTSCEKFGVPKFFKIRYILIVKVFARQLRRPRTLKSNFVVNEQKYPVKKRDIYVYFFT